MPNWCGNTMTVTGEPDKVNKFIKDFTKEGFACIGDYPNISDENDDGWYEWRVENWSTKWNLNKDGIEILQDNPGIFSVFFYTAWRDPEEFIKKASIKYGVTIEDKFEEPGMGCYGYYKVVNGVIVEEYIINDNDFKQSPEVLEKVFGSIEQAYEYFNTLFEEDTSEEIKDIRKYLKGLL